MKEKLKKIFQNKPAAIIIGALVLLFVAVSLFYGLSHKKETSGGRKGGAEEIAGNPVDIFLDLLERQQRANYLAVYYSQMEEATSTDKNFVRKFTVSVKQEGDKQKTETWLNTAKTLSLIKNADGFFACNWAENYKSPPCYKITPADNILAEFQKIAGMAAANIRTLAAKGFLEISVVKKKVKIGVADRSCFDFAFAIKPEALGASEIKTIFPVIADVSDVDIEAAKKNLSLIKSETHVCLDAETGVPLEADSSISFGQAGQKSSQRPAAFVVNPNFKEQMAFETLQRYDDVLAKYAFGKMIAYDNALYVAARGMLVIRDGKIIEAKNDFGSIDDFIIHDGKLYIAAAKGIFRLAKDGEWEKMKLNKSTFGEGFDSFKESNGEIYAVGEYSGVFRLQQDLWVEAGKFPKSVMVNALYDHDGNLYARTNLDGIFRLENERWLPFLGSKDFGDPGKIQLRTYNKKLYALIGPNIYKIEDNKPVALSTYKEYGIANFFYEHSDGIYIGSRRGLFLIKDSQLVQVATEKQIGEANAIITFNGNLYIGSDEGVFVKEEDNWRQSSWFDDFGPVNTFFISGNNVLYAGGAMGLAKLVGNEWKATPLNLDDEKQNPNIETIQEFNGDIYAISVTQFDSSLYVLRLNSDLSLDEFGLPPECNIIEAAMGK